MPLLALLFITLFASSSVASEQPKWPTQDGVVTVVWQQPDTYRDVETNSGVKSRYQNHVFASLGNHLQQQITPHLADGEKVRITVQDLDLAGDVRPTFGKAPGEIRVVKSIFPPRISFDYQVTDASGNAKNGGKVELKDLSFDGRLVGRYRSDPLRYEKRMLDDWVNDSFN